MNGIRISSALHTVHNDCADSHHTLIGLVSCLTVDQGSQKPQFIGICCNRTAVCFPLTFCLLALTDPDDIHGFPLVNVESHINIVRIDIADIITEIHTDPLVIHGFYKFYGILIGKQATDLRVWVRFFSHPDDLRIQRYDPVSHILCQSFGLLTEQKVLILCPANDIAGF